MKISQEDLVFGEVVFTDLRMVTGEMFDLIKNHCGGITSLECYTEIVSLISHTCQEIIDQSTVQEGMSHQIKIMTVLIFFWRVIYSANQKMILDLALNRFKKISYVFSHDPAQLDILYQDVKIGLRNLSEKFASKMTALLDCLRPYPRSLFIVLAVIKTTLWKMEDIKRIEDTLREIKQKQGWDKS